MLLGKLNFLIKSSLSQNIVVERSIIKIDNNLHLLTVTQKKNWININYFFRSGFKSKIFNLFNFNIGWFLFNYKNFFLFKNNIINVEMFLQSISTNLLEDVFSFNNFNTITKHVRLSRKIRKYTKNKVRYRSFLVTLRNRQVFGTIYRMWNLIYLNYNDSYRLKSFIINNLLWNQLLVDSGDDDQANTKLDDGLEFVYDQVTPQKIQIQMFDDIIHRRK